MYHSVTGFQSSILFLVPLFIFELRKLFRRCYDISVAYMAGQMVRMIVGSLCHMGLIQVWSVSEDLCLENGSAAGST